MADETNTGPVTAGVTGQTACPNCGHAYDDHGLGGNCDTRSIGRFFSNRPPWSPTI